MNPLLVASGKGCHDKFITGGSSSAPESELEISLRLVWCQEMESCADPQPLLRLWRSEMLSESTCKSKPRDIIRSLQHWHRVDVFTLLSMLVVAAMLVMMAPPESFDFNPFDGLSLVGGRFPPCSHGKMTAICSAFF